MNNVQKKLKYLVNKLIFLNLSISLGNNIPIDNRTKIDSINGFL